MHPQSFFLTKRSQAAAAAAAAAQAEKHLQARHHQRKRTSLLFCWRKPKISSRHPDSYFASEWHHSQLTIKSDKIKPSFPWRWFENWTASIKSGNVNKCTTFCLSLLLSCRCSKMLNCVMIFHACDCNPPSCYIGLFSRHRVCEAPGPNFEPKIVKKAVKFSSPPQHSSHDCLIS